MANPGQATDVGKLRWYVTLANRASAPVGSSELDPVITPTAQVWADIRPTSLQTFIGSEQIDQPITHRIIIRWQSFANLGQFNIVQRTILLPDDTMRVETYHIQRVQEYGGRHRYILIDCELEGVSGS